MSAVSKCAHSCYASGTGEMRTFMKIRVLLPVVTLLAFWASEFGGAQTKPNPGSAIIIGLEAKWNAAYDRGDIATMNTLLADDFSGTSQMPTSGSESFSEYRRITPVAAQALRSVRRSSRIDRRYIRLHPERF